VAVDQVSKATKAAREARQAERQLKIAVEAFCHVKGRPQTSYQYQDAYTALIEAARFMAVKTDEEWATELVEAKDLLLDFWASTYSDEDESEIEDRVRAYFEEDK
jgi:hypothetical protein